MTTTPTQQAAFQALETYARAVLKEGTAFDVVQTLSGASGDFHSATDIAYEVLDHHLNEVASATTAALDPELVDAVHDLVAPYLLARLAPEPEPEPERVLCTCSETMVQPGGAFREPGGCTHYSDRPCGPDLLGEDEA